MKEWRKGEKRERRKERSVERRGAKLRREEWREELGKMCANYK